MKIRSLIIDDEPLVRKVLQEHIDDIDFLELVGQAENPVKALKVLENNSVDILFIDVEMTRMNGIEFLKQYKKLPPVIITSAFPEYALESYQLDVVDYLVKPITFERFFKAANKVRDLI